MRLKKIRLVGFKSFVDATNIPFPGDMTAIVGPNGCGKSNVIDAVRWVLGESSAKNLRGDAMTDVIFNGSSARKAVSQCSVELVFDNSSGRIKGEYASFNEISVKRLVTKDAVSSYFLNSAKCRRRDITDLFLGTGLGPRSYAIIEQGMISKLIESKPQELRVFIEEAAGISKYKERRRETQNRIGHTKENLERLQDVRQELGDQIAKLKRQAAAATKYKELKQRERKLNAELNTLLWYAQSKLQAQIQQEIAERQQSMDSLVASQQGDESGLVALKNEQLIVKKALDDKQQSLFKLGTDITKLEQAHIFSQKRLSQIQQETEQIKISQSELTVDIDSSIQELQQIEALLESAEPNSAMLEAKLYEVEDRKITVDEQLIAMNREQKNQNDQFHAKKQNLQQKHSQIQQTIRLQERTNSRVEQLKREISDLSNDELDDEIELSKRCLDKQQSKVEQCSKAYQSEKHLVQDTKTKLNEQREVLDEHRQACLKRKAKIDALNSLQSQGEHKSLPKHLADAAKSPVWEYLKVEKGYEKTLEAALSFVGNASVIKDISLDDLVGHLETQGFNLIFEPQMSHDKQPGKLSEKIQGKSFPGYFNSIYVVESDEQAALKYSILESHEFIITIKGNIFTKDSLAHVNTQDNKVERQAELDLLSQELQEFETLRREYQEKVDALQSTLQERENSLSSLDDELREQTTHENELKSRLQNLHYQQEQNHSRSARLKLEIEEQQERLEQEEMSLHLLNEEVEDLSIEVAQLEEAQFARESENQALQAQQQELQIQYNQVQNELHQHAMQNQQLQSKQSILSEKLTSKNKQYELAQQKLNSLLDEVEDLKLPENQVEDKLQAMLSQQGQLREEQKELQESLDNILSDITDLEKGQHGLQTKIDQIKTEIEGMRIRAESANVRAQSFIEQLAKQQQNIKEVMNMLEEEEVDLDSANADEWQKELDSLSASLSRLGAVNLAAVDEYEEQSARKQHLDDQHLDLTQALDTLENAMRRIDKETRARFKNTYDQVNTDLKALFPKVFGGGSAHLALTGEDFLETGVTIMARPPGKKNSTIHLLSGGEKALTALSLVFAIFRLNPAPFCLLDEVDAPLDDANVGRFCRLVSEMSKTVQFIYISHNKVAMEMATHLTGVTMAEPGVSRMVAVDMEEALAIAE